VDGWGALKIIVASGLVALVITVMTFTLYRDLSELRAHGVIASTPGTVAVSTVKNDDIEVLFRTNAGSGVTGTLVHELNPRPLAGSRISVRYSPTEPTLIAEASYPMGYGTTVFGGALAALMWIVMGFGIRAERANPAQG